jgi:monoamine oxidase
VCIVPFLPPGALSEHEHARRTKHKIVHFVGTETAHEWKGYMDGAIRSGEWGAREVVQELNRGKL